MVFSNLSHHEKDAFFSLLDEYFQSRPELAAKLQGTSGNSDDESGLSVGQVAGRVAAAASAFNNAPPPSRHVPPRNLEPPAGLVSRQRLGDVDTSSKKSMLVSGLSRKQPTVHNTPIVPSAFGPKKNSFAPPPPHRAPEPEPEPEEEPEEGEWAEVLYDYDSQDPADLRIRANQRILVTERTSDDWWKGEVDGKSGLFPATYVKLL
ncbi:SH3-domain-containing protein [Lentinula aciculospora]|uniref:SH3-domain-containing protein n=1 Tax=Lentinula aciculospora TaxID=153920 RepID=A0A9W9A2V6_9AGAR|nr:SH3-domain-containing protein [Lentinula aciculospora]